MELKNLLIMFVLFAFVAISSCKDGDDFQSTGLIIGPDVRDCICCGGFVIEIEDSTYNFDALPGSSPIDLENETFPVKVKLDWTHERLCGDIQYISISRIEKE